MTARLVTVVAGALGPLWAALVLRLAWRHRPLPHLRRLDATVRRAPRRPVPPAVRRLVPAAVVAVVLLPVAGAVGPVAGAAVWVLLVRRQRRRAGGEQAATVAALPEAVDLYALAAAAGLTVPDATAEVAVRVDGPLGAGLGRVVDEVRLGRRCSDALDDLPGRLGEPVRPLVTVLLAAERDGTPLGPNLARLAAELRADRRRRAETAARQVPVKLLFPLVCCVLPAFGLLTVAPMLAGAFDALRP